METFFSSNNQENQNIDLIYVFFEIFEFQTILRAVFFLFAKMFIEKVFDLPFGDGMSKKGFMARSSFTEGKLDCKLNDQCLKKSASSKI